MLANIAEAVLARLRSPFSLLRFAFHTRTESRTFALNTSWAMLGQVLAVIVSLTETVLLARFLGVTSFGIFLVLSATSELVFGLLDCRSGEAIVKFLPEFEKRQGATGIGALIQCVLLIDTVIAVLGFILVCLLVRFFGQYVSVPAENVNLALILAAGAGLRATMGSVGAYLRVTYAFPLAVKIGIAASLTRLGLCGAAILIRPTVTNVCIAVGVADALMGIALLGALHRQLNVNGVRLQLAAKLIWETLRSLARFMFHTNLASTIRVLAKKADVLLIAALSSTGAVALYKTASRIAGALLLFSDPLVTVVFPTLSRLHTENRVDQIKRLITMLTGVLLCVVIMFVTAFAFTGKRVLGSVLGGEYEQAFSCTLILLAGFSASMVFFWTRPLMLVHGLTMRIVQVGVLAIGIQFLILWLTLPYYGAAGAAFGAAAYQIIVVVCYLALLSRHRWEYPEVPSKAAPAIEP